MATKFVLKRNSPGSPDGDGQTLAEYGLDHDLFTIGSDAANNLVLAEIAPEQAVVVQEGEFLTLINRAEGTALNEKPLRREAFQPLAPGDRIEIGDYRIFVVEDSRQNAQDNAKTGFLFAENENLGSTLIQPTAPTAKTETLPVTDETENASDDGLHSTNSRKFADILDTLRTEEDSFYFIIENEARKETGRIALEQAEMVLGASRRGELTTDAAQIAAIFAVVRKDWSGILLEPQKSAAVFINAEPLKEQRRLRNGDKLTFSTLPKAALVLHEPTSLVALESLLATRGGSGDNARFGIQKIEDRAVAETAPATKNQKKVSMFERIYFGHFSFFEMLMMLIGTLALAILWFLFFEFSFS